MFNFVEKIQESGFLLQFVRKYSMMNMINWWGSALSCAEYERTLL